MYEGNGGKVENKAKDGGKAECSPKHAEVPRLYGLEYQRHLIDELSDIHRKNREEIGDDYDLLYAPDAYPKYDEVSAPRHYIFESFEVRGVIAEVLDEFDKTVYASGKAAHYYADALEYLMRWFRKNGIKDLKKARWYLDELIKTIEEG